MCYVFTNFFCSKYVFYYAFKVFVTFFKIWPGSHDLKQCLTQSKVTKMIQICASSYNACLINILTSCKCSKYLIFRIFKGVFNSQNHNFKILRAQKKHIYPTKTVASKHCVLSKNSLYSTRLGTWTPASANLTNGLWVVECAQLSPRMCYSMTHRLQRIFSGSERPILVYLFWDI
jgi:hypothetical protein